MSKFIKPLTLSIGAALLGSIAFTATADNPFAVQKLNGGYSHVSGDEKAKEGSCGGEKAKEGSCGGDKAKEGSCGGDKAKEGSCGGDKEKAKGKEGKCGEGKCGGQA